MNGGQAEHVRIFLVVEGGMDDGVRLLVDDRPKSVGRGRDGDLVLRDPATSRRHAEVWLEAGLVQVKVSAGAAPFLLNGRLHERGAFKPGERLLIGDTWLRVEADGGRAAGDHASTPSSDIKTLLSGASLDVRGLAALFALVEALDAAATAPALEETLSAWASRHGVASRVAVQAAEEAQPEEGDAVPNPRIFEQREAPEIAVLSVPTMCEPPLRLSFTAAAEAVTDSYRCLLVVAARVFGSASARVRRLEVSAQEKEALRELRFGSARAFLGTSPAARQLSSHVPRLAASDVSALIEGETGVGKTFFARLIHESSKRASEPLRVINCASIPESLLESELFGHERGAFTGASAARAGALEAAGDGTLFLDEIGELSLASQAKLLRALEDKRFERLGSNRTLTLRARVLCATNRDLAARAKEGLFRSDLLFRISVVKLTIPPLRERGDDLLLLAQQLLADAAAGAHRRVEGFSAKALDVIRRYSWPGNVRELRNAIEHALVLGEDSFIEATDLPAGILAEPSDAHDRGVAALLNETVEAAERGAIADALRATGGNRTRAAALLGITRMTLHTKLNRM